ncbi:hypothetical protein BGZ60DRAFT_410785 [Tricladium varicosporioides]|nr:hypothetical protein BGZ60DRAFT_410785 [Hymenoscyphus varicosporioides]
MHIKSAMQTIPLKCTVLVVGGGPGDSSTASALAREGIDTVPLEVDIFPGFSEPFYKYMPLY